MRIMNKSVFTQREMSEIELALFYVMRCKHGTAGHNRLLLIAKMAQRMGIVMDANRVMIVPSDVTVEPYDLGPATARVKIVQGEAGVILTSDADVEAQENGEYL